MNKRVLTAVALLFLTTSAFAKIEFPETTTLNGKKLSRNGTAIRTATFLNFKVYSAALYLEKANKDSDSIIQSTETKQFVMQFMRDVSAEKIRSTWTEAFHRNCEPLCKEVEPTLEQLKALMPDMKEGDEIRYDFFPEKVTILINKVPKLDVAGVNFGRTLLQTWIGKKPPSPEFKEGLLGVAKN